MCAVQFADTRFDHQRINPLIIEAFQKEILNWLSAGVTYPLADSKLVSPIQLVPKKKGDNNTLE